MMLLGGKAGTAYEKKVWLGMLAPEQCPAYLRDVADELVEEVIQQDVDAILDTAAKAAYYDVACRCACRGLRDECHTWLSRASLAGTLPKPKELSEDIRLGVVRDEPWFSEFLRS
jgi:hypothetical protein